MSVSMAALGGSSRLFWTPSLLSSLGAWYDASDATTITLVSSAVSQWNDKSGNGRNLTQSTAGSRPTVASADQNGRDTLSLASGKFMSHSPSSKFTGNALSVAAVCKPVTGGSRLIAGATSAGEDWNSAGGFNFSHTSPNMSFNCNQIGVGAAVTASTWNVAVGVFNGTAQAFHMNGGTASSTRASAPNLDVARYSIGNSYNAGSTWNGSVAEVLIVPAALSTSDRQRVEGYLAHRWGLTGNLPSDHPYKSVAP